MLLKKWWPTRCLASSILQSENYQNFRSIDVLNVNAAIFTVQITWSVLWYCLYINFECIAFISLSTFNNKDIFHKLRGNCYEKSSLAASKYVLGIHWTSLYFWIYVQKEHILYITRHMKHNLDSLSTTCIEKKYNYIQWF